MLLPANVGEDFMTARTSCFLYSLAVSILVLFVSGGMSARAADRLALVIGNAHYASVPCPVEPHE